MHFTYLVTGNLIDVFVLQRAYAVRFTPPFTMIGSAVAKVIQSKDKDFPVGSRIVISHGWVKRGKVNPKQGRQTPGERETPIVETRNIFKTTYLLFPMNNFRLHSTCAEGP